MLSRIMSCRSGSCDPIRDMQFGIHPNHVDIFVAADDGGSVRFWDLRRNDRPLYQFVAHHGPSSVALNPSYDDQNLIATAGRDKFIRVSFLAAFFEEKMFVNNCDLLMRT